MTPSLNLTYKDAASHTDAKTLLALFERAADTYGLEPYESDGITEARRILDLADQVDKAAWDAKQNKPYKAISTALIDGALDPTEAVTKITQAEHQAKMNEGAHTPASRLAINIRGAAVPHVRDQDETTILEWLSAPFGQAVANASAHADVVDSILGTEPRRDAPGVRSLDHHWAPRANQLKLFGTPFGKRGSDDRVAVGRVSDSGVHPSDRWAAMALPWRGAVSCWVRRVR